MFDAYMNIPEGYIPNNLFKGDIKYCKEKDCIFTIGATNEFVQNLNISRSEIKSINEPYPRDKAIYFIFKNGISEIFEIPAEIIPINEDDIDYCPIIARCQIDDNFLAEHNIKINPYLDFKVQLKIILVDDAVLYTNKKDINIITSLDK